MSRLKIQKLKFLEFLPGLYRPAPKPIFEAKLKNLFISKKIYIFVMNLVNGRMNEFLIKKMNDLHFCFN